MPWQDFGHFNLSALTAINLVDHSQPSKMDSSFAFYSAELYHELLPNAWKDNINVIPMILPGYDDSKLRGDDQVMTLPHLPLVPPAPPPPPPRRHLRLRVRERCHCMHAIADGVPVSPRAKAAEKRCIDRNGFPSPGPLIPHTHSPIWRSRGSDLMF
jgi:hypothetical protein